MNIFLPLNHVLYILAKLCSWRIMIIEEIAKECTQVIHTSECTQVISNLRSREWKQFAHFAGCLMSLSHIMFIRNSYQKGFCSLSVLPFKSHQPWKHTFLAHICSFYWGYRTYYLQELSKYHCYRHEIQIRQKTVSLKDSSYYVYWFVKYGEKDITFQLHIYKHITAVFKYARSRIYFCEIKNKLEPPAVVLNLIRNLGNFNKIRSIPVPWNFSCIYCLEVILPKHHKFCYELSSFSIK